MRCSMTSAKGFDLAYDDYTSRGNPLFYQTHRDLPRVERGSGIWLFDGEGNRYLDGCSGAVVASVGHGNERVIRAMTEQASKVAFAYRTQFESEPAMALGHRLAGQLSQGLERVFYVSGGSEAVESAIKLARQYHLATGSEQRHKVISRYPSYHGSTMGALATTGYDPLTRPFEPLLSPPIRVSAPSSYRCPFGPDCDSCAEAFGRELEQAIVDNDPETISAFILEPIGGASTGANVPPEGYFEAITRVCRRYGVLLIFDEVMTGAGRTGSFCAYQHWEGEAEVDILCLAKGLGAGYSPLGAVVCRTGVAEAVLAAGGFAHGHTYAGNPLSCAVGLAVLDVLEEDGLIENARERGAQLSDGLRAVQEDSQIVGDVRGKGLLLGVEFVANREAREPFPAHRNVHQRFSDIAFDEGLIVYPRRTLGGFSGDHVLVAPPLVIEAHEADDLLSRFARSVERIERELL